MDYTTIAYEDRLKLRSHHFEILKKFEFKYAPVGFKFLNADSDLKGLGLEPLGQEDRVVPDAARSTEGKGFLCGGGRPVLRTGYLPHRTR